MTAALFSASSLRGFEVYDRMGERLGAIADVMLAIEESRVRYVVLAYEDERGKAHDKLLAVPVTSLRLDTEDECFILDVERGALAAMPGIDPNAPPDEPDPQIASRSRPASRAARAPLS